MPKSARLNQRSIGTQSDCEVRDDGRAGAPRLFDITAKFSSLCKKSAYRNLLQRSITVDAHGKVNIAVEFGRSKATQTILENEALLYDDFAMRLRMKREESQERVIPMSAEASHSFASQGSRTDPSRSLRDDIPGTSRVITTVYESESQPECHRASATASGKESLASGVSAVPYIFENQGLRRQSDEAVLLVQDYQSYDYLNTARRQDVSSIHPEHPRRPVRAAWKKYKGKEARHNRPVPINQDTSLASGLVCRICHEGEDAEPLIRPCLCKGSVGSIHAKCLKIWLEQSNTSRCEICGYPYAIRQTRKYTKCVSTVVFLRTIIDRRALMYDIISFVAVTPLCIVGVAMCIRASLVTNGGSSPVGSNFQMGNVTRAGMIMLSSTIVIAYGVWLYTLLSYHYKSWKRWYSSCYDVEVIPVYMTSEQRLEALQRIEEETRRRSSRMERVRSNMTVLPPNAFPLENFFQRRLPVPSRVQSMPE